MDMAERGELAKQVYINAFSTDENFESPFGSDILYLVGAILRGEGAKTSLGVEAQEFFSELEPELQEQLKPFIMK